MFLKTIKEESGDFEDEYEDEDEDITFIARKIRKLLQFRKNDKSKAPRKFESFRKGKSEKAPIKCRECKGFGHMSRECPNYLMKEENKKSKGKYVRISALKSYCMMLCMTLCMT